jgi:hypothetical protein
MQMASLLHSLAQIPHPLQKSRSTDSPSTSCRITPSGQNTQHSMHMLHFSGSITGLSDRHEPVVAVR